MVCVLGYVRTVLIGIESIEIVIEDPNIDRGKLAAGIRSWYLGITTSGISIDRGRIAIWRESLPDWRGDSETGEFPRLYYKTYRSFPNFDRWAEWNDWSNWRFAGIGFCHDDRHPMGGLVSTPYDCRGIFIPNWLMILIMAIPWTNRYRRWRLARRFRPGHCPDCGYDLRGSPPTGILVECPECGNATAVVDSCPGSDSAVM